MVLGDFLDQYIAGRADVKPGTETNLEQARKKLVEYFGESKPLGAITPGDADQFRQDLESQAGRSTPPAGIAAGPSNSSGRPSASG